MTDKQIIIEDCPYFVNGVCMEYLDGACENHKCDLKIIRELEQKLKAKEQECERLKERLNCNCFDPKNNNNRCISYNRIAEDYERDLRQLDQLKEQLEAYKMEAEEGYEINAELKSENKHINDLLNQALKELEKTRETLT